MRIENIILHKIPGYRFCPSSSKISLTHESFKIKERGYLWINFGRRFIVRRKAESSSHLTWKLFDYFIFETHFRIKTSNKKRRFGLPEIIFKL